MNKTLTLIAVMFLALLNTGCLGENKKETAHKKKNEDTKTLAEKVEACVKRISDAYQKSTVKHSLTELETLIKDSSAEVKYPFSTTVFYDNYNNTLLCLAARYCKIHIAKSLLAVTGTDVNVKDESGNTPLHLAARYGSKVIVDTLLKFTNSEGKKITNVNVKDKDGQTPLHMAVIYGKEDMVDTLLEFTNSEGKKITNVNVKDLFLGETPLHLAVRKGREAIVKSLLAHGADVNAKDSNEQTPLQVASSRRAGEGIIAALNKAQARR